jgi:hypothetical protein
VTTSIKGYSLVKILAGVLLMVFALICLAVMVFNLAQDISIWALGRHTTAKVVDSWTEQTNGNQEGELAFRYFIRYQFTTLDGQVITGISSIGANEWAGLGVGSHVGVVYFPPYPGHNRLDDSRFISLFACTYLALGFLIWAGLVAGWQLGRPALANLKR